MNILVTGASGLVGRDLINKLSKENINIIAIYKTNSKIKKKFNSKRISWIKHDKKNKLKIDTKIDYIIHCAVTHHFSKNKSKKKFQISNILSIKNLIILAKQKKIKLFINLSTVSIYGRVKTKYLTEKYLPQKKISLLGKTKKMAEDLLIRSKLRYINIRLPGVLCSNMNKSSPIWLQKLILNIKQKKKINVYDSETFFNNLIDVNEIVKLILHLIYKKKFSKGTYNFAATQPTKLIEIINFLKKLFNSNSKIVSRTSGDSFIIGVEKLIKELNFLPNNTMVILKRYLKNEKIKATR